MVEVSIADKAKTALMRLKTILVSAKLEPEVQTRVEFLLDEAIANADNTSDYVRGRRSVWRKYAKTRQLWEGQFAPLHKYADAPYSIFLNMRNRAMYEGLVSAYNTLDRLVREGDQDAVDAFDVQVSELESALFDKIEGRGAKPGRPRKGDKPVGRHEARMKALVMKDKEKDYTNVQPDEMSRLFDIVLPDAK